MVAAPSEGVNGVGWLGGEAARAVALGAGAVYMWGRLDGANLFPGQGARGDEPRRSYHRSGQTRA
jgi:hypothetical protein